MDIDFNKTLFVLWYGIFFNFFYEVYYCVNARDMLPTTNGYSSALSAGQYISIHGSF